MLNYQIVLVVNVGKYIIHLGSFGGKCMAYLPTKLGSFGGFHVGILISYIEHLGLRICQ